MKTTYQILEKHTVIPQHYDIRVTRAMEEYAAECNSELQRQRNKLEDENAKLIYKIEDLESLNEGQAMRLKLCLEADINEYTDRIESLEKERLYMNSTMDELKQDCIDRASQVIDVVSENELLKEAMREFVERVDKGEVRSTYTYNKFKKLLNK